MSHILAHSKVKTNFSLSFKKNILKSALKRIELSYKTFRD